jgi:hypothetical protein
MDLNEVARELGSRGGKKTLKEHGLEHYRHMKQLSDEAKKRKKQADSILPIDKR